MAFYATPDDEAVAVRRAAARAGCRVLGVEIGCKALAYTNGVVRDAVPVTVGSCVRADIDCRDGWAAAKLLLALAIEDARTDGAKAIADELRADGMSDEDFARRIHAYVLAHVKFIPERVEEFESGSYTLALGGGDCDAHFRLSYALAVAGGLPAALGILWHGPHAPRAERGPAHAVVLFGLGGGWVYGETTVAADFGEEPNAAARRLGLTDARTDIAKELRVMTENDLAPLPPNYREHNDPAQVALDAQALQRLGYLPPDAPAAAMTDPTAIVLRLAVLDFQRAQGIVADGLLGPTTRLTIAHALTAAGVEGFDYPGIGGVVTSLTGDLTDSFLSALVDMAGRFQAKGATATAEDFARVFMNESGINAHRANGAGFPYGGLNQMGLQQQRGAGFALGMGAWLALSNEAQLPYVERYYINAIQDGARGDYSTLRDAGSVYVATFAPAFMSKAGTPDAHLYDAPSQNYTANAAAFDTDHKGYISPADLARAVAHFDTDPKGNGPRWREVKARLADMGGGGSGGGGVASSAVAVAGTVIATVAALGGLAWWALRT